MAIVYVEYLVPVTPGQTLARLRTAAEAASWVVVEESPSGVFYVERRRLWSYAIRGWASYLAIDVEDFHGGTAIRFVGWHGLGSNLQAHIWRLLFGAGFVSAHVPPGSHSALPQASVARCRLDVRTPSWVKWTRFGEFGWALLILPFIALIILLHDAYAPVLFGAWIVFLWLAPVLVTELVPRRALGIRSRQGIGHSLVYMGGHLALIVAIIFVVSQILS